MAIKALPEDFQVEEILSSSWKNRLSSKPGPFALYRMSKRGVSTPEAMAQLARRWQMRPAALAYGGLKDKHAIAIQHISVRLAPDFTPPPEKDEGEGLKLQRLGYLDDPIDASAIAANRFRITVRDLGPTLLERMEQGVDTLKMADGSLLGVNYFGDQRFGSARHGQGFLAKDLIRGNFEEALKLAIAVPARKDRHDQKEFKRTIQEGWGRWQEILPRLKRCPDRAAIEVLATAPQDFKRAFTALPYFFQQLCVFAYQSWLWNETARMFIEERFPTPGLGIAVEDPFGTMLFPAASSVPAEMHNFDLPLLGNRSELREPWAKVVQTLLDREGITTAMLRIPGMRRPFFSETPRALFLVAKEFTMGQPGRDEQSEGGKRQKRQVSFLLPRGAYATVIMRALGH